jgi:ubiquinone/menaquinone biosynthesis C-methylase UbiE
MTGMSTNTETQPTPDDVEALIPLLDAVDSTPGAAELRSRSYELLDLASATAVVDVGCGAGRAVAEIAERSVRMVGVDVSEPMIAVARRRWPGRDFRLGSAYALPLGEGEVAGYRADKVFHELDDPERALVEARRVLAVGGRIVLIGQDWDSFVIDSDDAALTRTIVHARADLTANPRAARRYRNLLLDTGFRDVTVEAHTAVFTDTMMLPMLTGFADAACSTGAITRDRADTWITEQTERAAAGRLFLAIPLFVASAVRN